MTYECEVCHEECGAEDRYRVSTHSYLRAHKKCAERYTMLPWAVRMYRLGCCVNCGKKRGDSPYKRHCVDCRKSITSQERKYKGSLKWMPGKKGRPPAYVTQERRTSL